MGKLIYFDHNATTAVDERVVEAMLPYFNTFYGNPSALYRLGRFARSAIDTARAQVAALVGVKPSQIIFTSSGTEANNLALKSISRQSRIVVSSVEHPSIIEPVNRNSIQIDDVTIPVDKNGLVSLAWLNDSFKQQNRPSLVSVMMANNETGVLQNIKAMADQLQGQEVIIHTDAIQTAGKIPVSFNELGVQLMSLSSHKLYGPKGCGALVVDKTIEIEPLLMGGGQENNWRAGTENVAAIVGFGKAAELAVQDLEQRTVHLLALRTELEHQLKTIPGLVIFAEQAERLVNTVQFGIQGIDGEMLLMQLDQKNIAVSSGSACSSGGGKASPVLTAMGVETQLAKSAVRISLGKDNTEVEIKQFIEILKTIVTNS